MFALIAAAALAAIPLDLPPTEAAEAWREALALGGFTAARAGAGPMVRVEVVGERWRIVARDAAGVVREAWAEPPETPREREGVALLAESLLHPPPAWSTFGAEKSPVERPSVMQPPAKRPAAEPSAAKKPAVEKSASEKLAEARPAVERPAEEMPAEEMPAEEMPPAEEPPAEEPRAPEPPAVDAEPSGVRAGREGGNGIEVEEAASGEEEAPQDEGAPDTGGPVFESWILVSGGAAVRPGGGAAGWFGAGVEAARGAFVGAVTVRVSTPATYPAAPGVDLGLQEAVAWVGVRRTDLFSLHLRAGSGVSRATVAYDGVALAALPLPTAAVGLGVSRGVGPVEMGLRMTAVRELADVHLHGPDGRARALSPWRFAAEFTAALQVR
jgi:hypothetical protein